MRTVHAQLIPYIIKKEGIIFDSKKSRWPDVQKQGTGSRKFRPSFIILYAIPNIKLFFTLAGKQSQAEQGFS
jgi:hypothetical protein